MTRITLKIDQGKATLVRRGLEALRRKMPHIGRSRLYAHALEIVSRMRPYPPELPGQRYVRTGLLGRSWKVKRHGETGYQISNRAYRRGRYYAKWVIGTAYGTHQAEIHRGRWKLLRDEVDREVQKKMPLTVARQIKLVARRENLDARDA